MEDKAELFEAVLAQMPEGIIIIGKDDRILFVNEKGEQIRRIAAANVVGRSVLSCHPDKSHERVRRALDYLKAGKQKDFTRMVVDHVNDRYYENTYAGIRNARGEYIGSIVISRDVIERRKLDEERATYLRNLEERLAELTKQLEDLFVSSMSSLVNVLEAKDPYTEGHSLRVCETAVKMAEHRWGVSQEARDVELAAKLHDIGKIAIREAVLNKPARLTDEEFAHIKTHPVIGERILSPFGKLKAVTLYIRHHHERFDGSGYPDGLSGEQIPVGARILAIADSYDAMVSTRPYRAAMEPAKAVKEIESGAGTQFDPEWCEVFLELFRSGSLG